MPALLISYRRQDSAAHAGRLYDRLVAHYGRDAVFMDIDTIRPGEDFVAAIERALGRAGAVLVLIGPRWAEFTDSAGRRRLDDPGDFVRLEVATALGAGARVIPVLVGGAVMPDAPALPGDVAAIARRQAFKLSDERFHADVDALIAFLDGLEAPPPVAAGVTARAGDARQAREAPPAGDDSGEPSALAAARAHHARLLGSPWLERSVLWSLGLLSVGLYYHLASAHAIRAGHAVLDLTERRAEASPMLAFPGPLPRDLLPGLAAHVAGWVLGVAFAAVVVQYSVAERYLPGLLLGSGLACFWLGSALGLRWLWLQGRRLEARREALAPVVAAAVAEFWPASEPDWQGTALQKVLAFLVMFALAIYLMVMLERSVLPSLETGTSAAVVLRGIVETGGLLTALAFTLLQAGHACHADLLWPLLGQRSRGWSLASLRRRAFWPWLYLNAGFALYALFRVHAEALRGVAVAW